MSDEYPVGSWQWVGINLASGGVSGIASTIVQQLIAPDAPDFAQLIEISIREIEAFTAQAILDNEMERQKGIARSLQARWSQYKRDPPSNKFQLELLDAASSDLVQEAVAFRAPASLTFLIAAGIRLDVLLERKQTATANAELVQLFHHAKELLQQDTLGGLAKLTWHYFPAIPARGPHGLPIPSLCSISGDGNTTMSSGESEGHCRQSYFDRRNALLLRINDSVRWPIVFVLQKWREDSIKFGLQIEPKEEVQDMSQMVVMGLPLPFPVWV